MTHIGDSLAILMGKPTRAELEQQIEDMKREVQFWKQMVDDVAEDYERELERLEDQRINVHVEPISNEALDLVSDLIAKSLRKQYLDPTEKAAEVSQRKQVLAA